MLGPVFAVLQTPIWKAMYWEVGILGGYYIVTSIVHVIIYPYGALLENLTIILKAIVLGLIYYSSSAVLGAAGTVWLADKLLAYFWLDKPAR
ncbi:MAG TPA: hypothetical protein VNJ09_02615 [Chthonomonadales bacterium]|nr:hypothetical protein [Chthonomonadales bacterium]